MGFSHLSRKVTLGGNLSVYPSSEMMSASKLDPEESLQFCVGHYAEATVCEASIIFYG